MKILVYGTGVIGSVLAAKLWYASHEVYVCSRGERLNHIRENGIVVRDVDTGKRIVTFPDIFLSDSGVEFHMIIVAVRFDQLLEALPHIASIPSGVVVFMLNNPAGFQFIQEYIPADRFIPGFPGFGGEFVNHEVHYRIIAPSIQSTTIAQHGADCFREGSIPEILRHAGFPTQCTPNMDAWLKVHAAIICPIANALYLSNGSAKLASKSFGVRYKMAKSMGEGLSALQKLNVNYPLKFKLLRYMPSFLVAIISRFVLATSWANNEIASHANKAKTEMYAVNNAFINFVEGRGMSISSFKQMAIEANMYNK